MERARGGGLDLELKLELAWLRGLARALAGEGSDDLAQDAWVAALEQNPARSLPMRPWFAAVLRNLNRMRRRTRAREAQRLRAMGAASRGESAASPESLLERVESERELLELVAALEEPCRAVVLLRFHEGLSSAEIARQRGVPAGTVRWQLKAGLDRIREQLAERHRGEPNWSLAMLATALGAGRSTSWEGAAAMSARMKAAWAGAGLLMLAALGVWLAWPSARPAVTDAARANRPVASEQGDDWQTPTRAQAARKPAPSAAPRASDAGAIAMRPDAGNLLFGPLVAMGQGFTLAEMLSKNAANADQYVDRFCDQTRQLNQTHPEGPPPGAQSDAAQFFAPLIDYEKPMDEPPGKLHLPQALRDRVGGYGAQWPTAITAEDLAGLDFSWLDALSQFDHWSLYGAGRLRDLPAGGNPFTEPIPNYLSIWVWTKLRYAQSIRQGDTLRAAAQMQQLTLLLRSQDALIAIAVAIAIDKEGAQARDAVAAAGGDVSAWPAPDLAGLQSYRQMEFASMYFAYPGVSEATLRRAFACMPSPCMSLLEGANANRAIGAYVEGDNLALIDSLAREANCDPRPFAHAGASAQLSPMDALTSAVDDLGSALPSRFAAPSP